MESIDDELAELLNTLADDELMNLDLDTPQNEQADLAHVQEEVHQEQPSPVQGQGEQLVLFEGGRQVFNTGCVDIDLIPNGPGSLPTTKFMSFDGHRDLIEAGLPVHCLCKKDKQSKHVPASEEELWAKSASTPSSKRPSTSAISLLIGMKGLQEGRDNGFTRFTQTHLECMKVDWERLETLLESREAQIKSMREPRK